MTRLVVGKNDLATKKPYLLNDWDYKKNGSLLPSQVSYGSSDVKVWWKCHKCGYEWQSTPNSRTDNCPVCVNHIIVSGINDLATTHPHILKYWDYSKNVNILPTQVSHGSTKHKVWWVCEKGHSWRTSIADRVSHSGCPYCKNKRVLAGYNDLATTHPDIAKEWNYEKNNGVLPTQVICGNNHKFWFKCSKGHEWQAVLSSRKYCGCPICSGRKVLPGFNDLATIMPELVDEWDYVKNRPLLPTMVTISSAKKIWWKCKHGHSWQAPPYNRKKHIGCPFCGNQKLLRGFNDLQTKNPELAKEWHPTKNGDLKPSDVFEFSNRKVWWRCSHGHEWYAVVSSRSSQGGRGCPVCAGQMLLSGYNDLATKAPELLIDWNYEKNGSLLPSMVMPCTDKQVWWKCHVCGHEWKCKICNKKNAKGTGCPRCSFAYGTSFAEQAIYYYLKQYFGDKEDILNRYKFVYQDLSFELDIFIPTMALAVEHDGSYWHRNKQSFDSKKDSVLRQLGIRLIRVKEHPDLSSLFTLIGLDSSKVDFNVKRFRQDILRQYQTSLL